MASVLQVNARGLVTAPNPLLVPRDALVVADNVVLDRPGLIQSRRGFQRYAQALGGPAWAVAPYAQRLVANYGSLTVASNLRINTSNDGSGAWAAVTGGGGTVTNTVASGERMQTAEALGSLFLTCAQGVQKLTASTLQFAGLPRCLGLDKSGPASVLTGTGGFLADGQCVAYRAVVGRTVGSAVQLGAPSSRTVVANATGTSGYSAGVAKNVVARVLLPKQANTTGTALTSDYFLQLYRSGQVANGQTPSDELQLVWEAYLSATDISNGYVDVTDNQPDALRGAYLYTNPNTGEEGVRAGILNANDIPPNAWDVAWWRDCMWYADRSRGTSASGYQRQRLLVQLLGVGTGGLQSGDTLEFTEAAGGAAVTTLAAGTDFAVVSSSTASANIEATATNLVTAFNKKSTNYWAQYVSGSAPDAPGKILFEGRTNQTVALAVEFQPSTGTAMPWMPALPQAPLALTTSSADGAGNRLYFSKPGQPEAVPAINFLEVGPTGSNILRLVALSNQLYVLSDAGLYRVVGTDYTNFSVDPVDLTVVCAAPQTAVTLDGSLYFLTNQGAVEVTDGAVAYVSADIDSDLRQTLSSLLYSASNGTRPLALYAFAVAHPVDHRVLFWMPASTSATSCNYAYVYDRRARAWTRWYRGASLAAAETHSCGCYSQSGPTSVGMTLGTAASVHDAWFYVERRSFTNNDYADQLNAGTVVPIPRVVTWAYQDANDASVGKHWREVQFLFGDARPLTPVVTLSTEVQTPAGAEQTASVTTTYALPVANKMHRIPVGRACGRSARLSVTLSALADTNAGFDVAGLAVSYRPYSSRVSRGP
jgi:hypothetical protein